MQQDKATVSFWLSRLAPSTRKTGGSTIKRFESWLRVNGGAFKDTSLDELVAAQKNADNGSRYDVLDLVQRYVNELQGRHGYKKLQYAYLRSFFLHNRADLPGDRSFRMRGDEPKVRGNLTLEQVRDIIVGSDSCYAAVFATMFQAGMDQESFVYWNLHGYADLKRQLDEGAMPVKIELPGRKRSRNESNYYTWIGQDAINLLRVWLTERDKNPTVKDSKAIFVNQWGNPITKGNIYLYWMRHLRRKGLLVPEPGGEKGNTRLRYGKGPHELRDLFRSQWAKSPAKPEVGEYCLGHTIDPSEYNKAYRDEAFYRAEYLKALPFIQILSSGRPFHQISEDEVESLRTEVERLRAKQMEDREENRVLKERIETIAEARSRSDSIMDNLFDDPVFLSMLKQRLSKLQVTKPEG
jgi:hypothetical protein